VGATISCIAICPGVQVTTGEPCDPSDVPPVAECFVDEFAQKLQPEPEEERSHSRFGHVDERAAALLRPLLINAAVGTVIVTVIFVGCLVAL
jgi:hypothetical protein